MTETFSDRLFWFLLGCAVGAVLGYLSRVYREVKATRRAAEFTLEKVKKMEKDDRGSISFNNIALILVILLTLFAAFQSQRSANQSNDALEQVQKTQMVLQKTQQCTENYVNGTLQALNERTTFSSEQAQANITLQKSQADLIFAFLNPPEAGSVDESTRDSLERYFDALQAYNGIVAKAQEKVSNFPYPSPEGYRNCIANTEGISDE